METIKEESNKVNKLINFNYDNNNINYLTEDDDKMGAWKARIAGYLKEGLTLDDNRLARMGTKENILKYFPMADPLWSPKANEVYDFLGSGNKKAELIKKINSQLKEKDGTLLVEGRESKNLSKVEIAWMDWDLGFFNVNYKLTLNWVRLRSFNTKTREFNGTASFHIYARVPDGLFKGAKVSFNAQADVTCDVTKPFRNTESIGLIIDPTHISVSSDEFTVKGSSHLSGVLAALTGVLAATYLRYTLKFYMYNNTLKLNLGKVLGVNLGKKSIKQFNPKTYLSKYFGDEIDISIPLTALRINAIPKSVANIKTIAGKIGDSVVVKPT